MPKPAAGPVEMATIDALLTHLVDHWHHFEPEHTEEALRGRICDLHRYNFLLWHEEDIARSPSVTDGRIAQVKRAIDRYNQLRNDCIEKVDDWLVADLAARGIVAARSIRMDDQIRVDHLAIHEPDRDAALRVRDFTHGRGLHDHRASGAGEREERVVECRAAERPRASRHRELSAAFAAGGIAHLNGHLVHAMCAKLEQTRRRNHLLKDVGRGRADELAADFHAWKCALLDDRDACAHASEPPRERAARGTSADDGDSDHAAHRQRLRCVMLIHRPVPRGVAIVSLPQLPGRSPASVKRYQSGGRW